MRVLRVLKKLALNSLTEMRQAQLVSDQLLQLGQINHILHEFLMPYNEPIVDKLLAAMQLPNKIKPLSKAARFTGLVQVNFREFIRCKLFLNHL